MTLLLLHTPLKNALGCVAVFLLILPPFGQPHSVFRGVVVLLHLQPMYECMSPLRSEFVGAGTILSTTLLGAF